jgi:hypothetical protein
MPNLRLDDGTRLADHTHEGPGLVLDRPLAAAYLLSPSAYGVGKSPSVPFAVIHLSRLFTGSEYAVIVFSSNGRPSRLFTVRR